MSEKIDQNTQQSTATQRREQIKALEQKQKITFSRILVYPVEKAKDNADVGMGTITDFGAGLVCVLISQGSYYWASLAFFVYIFLCIIKHKVPEGPLSIWLKKPMEENIKNIEHAIENISETYARRRMK